MIQQQKHTKGTHEKRNVVYLALFIAMFLNLWGVKPFGLWPNDVFFGLKLGYLAFGYIFLFHYKVTFSDRRLRLFWIIIAGILLSMIPANLYYGQNFLTSFVTYRVNFLWFAIPVFFKMRPTFRQIAKSCVFVTAVMYVLFFIRQSSPDLFVLDEESLMQLQQGEDVYLNGFVYSSIPIFYYLGVLRQKMNINAVIVIIFCYVYIFLLQNRSVLFVTTLVITYSIFQIRSKYKPLIIVGLVALLVYFVAATSQEWMSLIQETQGQVSDTDYNRNLSYVYFLTMASPNVWCMIFGNGFLSSHTTTHMQDMMALGVYNSDVGLIGFWNQYGIIPVLVFIYTFAIAFKKDMPYGLKMWSLLLIGCTPTISYFHGAPLVYTLFYYLLMQYKYQSLSKTDR